MEIKLTTELDLSSLKGVEGWQDTLKFELDERKIVHISCLHPEVNLYIKLEDMMNVMDGFRQSFQFMKDDLRTVKDDPGIVGIQECPDCKAKLYFDSRGKISRSEHRI